VRTVAVHNGELALCRWKGGLAMERWYWIVVAIGVIALGAVKLSFFKRMMQNRAAKKRFEDED
jgi:hypothetical protein